MTFQGLKSHQSCIHRTLSTPSVCAKKMGVWSYEALGAPPVSVEVDHDQGVCSLLQVGVEIVLVQLLQGGRAARGCRGCAPSCALQVKPFGCGVLFGACLVGVEPLARLSRSVVGLIGIEGEGVLRQHH